MYSEKYICSFVFLIAILFLSTETFAKLSYVDPASGSGILDQVVTNFLGKVRSWQVVLQSAASNLFWTLALISLVWMGAMLILRRGEITDFFVEFTRFIIFTGFYFWLLTNAVSGHNIAGTILSSMQQLGGSAANLPPGADHTTIVNVGILIWDQAISNLRILDPIDSIVGFFLSLLILIILSVVSINMLLLLIASWVLMYAGIFLLGFGGARWTTDIALNYFRTVLSIGVQLLVMILIVGIGSDLLTDFYNKMSKNLLNYEELAVMLIFAIAFYVLITRLPSMVSSIVTYSGNGAVGGIGSSYTPQGMTSAGIAAAAATASAGVAAVYGVKAAMDYLKTRNHLSGGGASGESSDRANEMNQFSNQDYNLNQSGNKKVEKPSFAKGHYLNNNPYE